MIRPARSSEFDVVWDIDLDASVLFERAGLWTDFKDDHEFSVSERTRYLASLSAGKTLLAMAPSGEPVGFAALGTLDGEPYLDQLSVRLSHMQRGLGTALIEAVARLAASTGARTLWLTTYAHLPWNKPFYERRGFETIPATEWAPEIAGQISLQRKWLPFPDERVVMRRKLPLTPPYSSRVEFQSTV